MAECLLSLLTLLPLTLPLATPEEARSHDEARSLVARFHSYGGGNFEYPDNANIPLEGLGHEESLHVRASSHATGNVTHSLITDRFHNSGHLTVRGKMVIRDGAHFVNDGTLNVEGVGEHRPSALVAEREGQGMAG